jgi:hypothetical protein
VAGVTDRAGERDWDSIQLRMAVSMLPLDLTPGSWPGASSCWRSRASGSLWRNWGCTRLAGHAGRHAAGDGIRIRAVWE